MSTELDLVIIGAGCAGLSLGIHLANMGQAAPQTLLLDKRLTFENDRTWCFWGDQQTPLAALACHQWQQFTVQSERKKTLVDCALTPYRMLAAGDFYRHALQSIAGNQRLELKTGINLLAPPQFNNGKWRIVTSTGDLITKAIVDTRPVPIDQLSATRLWQSFLGYEVECVDDIFNPQLAQLMDFCPADGTAISFNYLLPLSKTRALIEFTTFAATPYSQHELLPKLMHALEKVTRGRSYTITRTEIGLIPMGLGRQPPMPHQTTGRNAYIYAGLTAGAARPATGYAFQRIQRWAAQCAQSIQRCGIPVGHQQDGFLLRQMDAIFLNVIRDQPAAGPALFMDLFSKVKPPQLIRFLSDQALMTDYFAVIKALPSRPFIKELFKRSALR